MSISLDTKISEKPILIKKLVRTCFWLEKFVSFDNCLDLKHPVEISTQATQIVSFKTDIAPKKLFFFLSSKLSSVKVPGEIILTTSLLSGPFLSFDLASSAVSVCSQTATLKPFLINFGK